MRDSANLMRWYGLIVGVVGFGLSAPFGANKIEAIVAGPLLGGVLHLFFTMVAGHYYRQAELIEISIHNELLLAAIANNTDPA